MTCQCQIYEICPQCAQTPEAYQRAASAYGAALKRQAQPRKVEAMTADELRELATNALTGHWPPHLGVNTDAEKVE